MKLKITIIFLFCAGLFVYFVFKGGYIKQEPNNSSSKPKLNNSLILKQIEALDLRNYHGDKVLFSAKSFEAPEKVVIHLWASWCGPCVNEVPELIDYSKKNEKIKFIIVSMDDYQDDIEKFLKSFPMFDSDRYFKIWDHDKKISKLFDADRLPMTILIDPAQVEPQLVKAVVDWNHLIF